MRVFGKFVGLALMLAGIYFLGQNIIFTTQTGVYWWQRLSAAGSVISLLLGIPLFVFTRKEGRGLGGFLIGLGIALVFINGGVILRPTSLWTFFLAFTSMIAGWGLLSSGRIRF